ncbi:hypothetical protein [Neorhizobium sp. DT-125]|uniref:hypothetical protein n=1 Tax=Neorhizobium sp. DT-125 TaxID=3396163 RepID=UPI003F1B39E8
MNRSEAKVRSLPAAVTQLIDEFELAFLVMKYGVSINSSSFSLSGLRLPFGIEVSGGGKDIEIGNEEFDGAFAIYTERIYDRLASLTENVEMMRTVRCFIDSSSDVRRAAAKNRAYFHADAKGLLTLTDALLRLDTSGALTELDAQLARHTDRLPELLTMPCVGATRDSSAA